MSDETPSLNAFGASFKSFLDTVTAQTPTEPSVFAERLKAHFGADAATFPVIEDKFKWADRPNLQVAIDAYLVQPGRSADLVGINVGGAQGRFMGVQLADLIARNSGMGGSGPSEGPVQYVKVPVDEDSTLTCVQCGLYLIKDAERRLAAFMGAARDFGFGAREMTVQVMASKREEAEQFLGELRTLMRKKNVYRGHIVSLDMSEDRTLIVTFHALPKIEREGIILPPGVLERIERNSVTFAAHRDKLLAAGRHLKRGILLYGPPGTGKTLTAMHLASRMPARTVFLLTGRGQGLLEASCSMARWLAPSTLILEDVDLIAEERTSRGADCTLPLLFELMNQMDGLADDADILFLLTTNRPDILEPALASRPGRIDQAIEIPLPDASCRRRLLDLYGRGLALRLSRVDAIIDRTEGVSAAFIRELLRKAALFSADEGGTIVVEDRHLEDALRELVVDGGTLTQSLLGARGIAPDAV
jgi:hypothetical protein